MRLPRHPDVRDTTWKASRFLTCPRCLHLVSLAHRLPPSFCRTRRPPAYRQQAWRATMVQLTFILEGRDSIAAADLRRNAELDSVERIILLAIDHSVRRRVPELSSLSHRAPPRGF